MPAALERILDQLAGAAEGVEWSGVVALALTGLLVGGVAFAMAIGVAYWIRHGDAPEGSGEAVSAAATRGLRRLRRARGSGAEERWLCSRCRSWNAPGAMACYRGCGPRDAVRMLLPGEVARLRDAGELADAPGVDVARADDPPAADGS